MFGLFSSPKCPKCGKSLPNINFVPSSRYRCKDCLRQEKRETETDAKIERLQKTIQQLENK